MEVVIFPHFCLLPWGSHSYLQHVYNYNHIYENFMHNFCSIVLIWSGEAREQFGSLIPLGDSSRAHPGAGYVPGGP